MIAKLPVVIPAAIFYSRLGLTPSGSGPVIISLIGTYIPILSPAKINCLYSPGTRPPYKAIVPSSAAIVFTVPMSPL